jgi:hypothetical protein
MNAPYRKPDNLFDADEYAYANPNEVTLVADAHGDVDVIDILQDYRVRHSPSASDSTDDAGFLAIMSLIRHTPERQRELKVQRQRILSARRQQDR